MYIGECTLARIASNALPFSKIPHRPSRCTRPRRARRESSVNQSSPWTTARSRAQCVTTDSRKWEGEYHYPQPIGLLIRVKLYIQLHNIVTRRRSPIQKLGSSVAGAGLLTDSAAAEPDSKQSASDQISVGGQSDTPRLSVIS